MIERLQFLAERPNTIRHLVAHREDGMQLCIRPERNAFARNIPS
jgi:hypothetical protein